MKRTKKMTEEQRLNLRLKWLEEAGLVVEYLIHRVIEKRSGRYPDNTPSLFLQTADADGRLTDKLIVNYFAEMARLAKNHFSTSSEFPVFGGID